MGVDVEDDGVVNNVGRLAAHFVRQSDDVVSDLAEVGEFLALNLLRELCPRLDTFWLMVKTQLEGASGDQAVTSGEEVETDDGLEHGRLSG